MPVEPGHQRLAVSFFGSLATYGVIMAVVGNFDGPIGATFSVPPTTMGVSLGILTLILGATGSYAHAFVAQMAVIALRGALLASLKIPNPTSFKRIHANG